MNVDLDDVCALCGRRAGVHCGGTGGALLACPNDAKSGFSGSWHPTQRFTAGKPVEVAVTPRINPRCGCGSRVTNGVKDYQPGHADYCDVHPVKKP
jgi:hypothetical protein